MKLTIQGSWASFNEYINAERRNRFLAAKMKKKEMERIMWQLPMETFQERIHLTFQPYLKDKKKDPDSVFFHIKCFLDAMQEKGMIENDGQKNIARITIEPIQIDKEERMEVTIREDIVLGR